MKFNNLYFPHLTLLYLIMNSHRPFIGRMKIKRYGRIGAIRVLKVGGKVKIEG